MFESPYEMEQKLLRIVLLCATLCWGMDAYLYWTEFIPNEKEGLGIISVSAWSIMGLIAGITSVCCSIKLLDSDITDLKFWILSLISVMAFVWLLTMLNPWGIGPYTPW